MSEFNLANNIAEFYHSNFNDWSLDTDIKNGGRGCTKSWCNAHKIAYKVLTDDNFSVMVLRQVHKTHRESTFNELCSALNDFGVRYKKTVAPLKIQVNNNIIYFSGLDDVEKLKGFKPETTPIRCVWFFEITEFESEFSVTQAKSSLARGKKESFTCLYEYNPPPYKTHWVYAWVEKMKKTKNTSVLFNTVFDIPERQRDEWGMEHLMNEAFQLKEIDKELFNHIYLGLPARVSGMIYKKFDIDKHVKNNISVEDIAEINIGVDWGQSDATTFTLTGITYTSKVKVLSHYYHKNGVSGGSKDINDYVDDLITFIREKYDKYRKPMNVILDSANLAQYELVYGKLSRISIPVNVYKTNKMKQVGALKGYGAIEERIAVTNVLFGNNFIEIDSSCSELINAFETCEYDKQGKRLDDGTFNIDSLDSFEYSILKRLNVIYNKILGGVA